MTELFNPDINVFEDDEERQLEIVLFFVFVITVDTYVRYILYELTMVSPYLRKFSFVA